MRPILHIIPHGARACTCTQSGGGGGGCQPCPRPALSRREPVMPCLMSRGMLTASPQRAQRSVPVFGSPPPALMPPLGTPCHSLPVSIPCSCAASTQKKTSRAARRRPTSTLAVDVSRRPLGHIAADDVARPRSARGFTCQKPRQPHCAPLPPRRRSCHHHSRSSWRVGRSAPRRIRSARRRGGRWPGRA